jgi:superfamily II DNA or RNA helicase
MPGDLTPRDLADEGTWSSEAGRCIRCTGHETLGCRTRYGTVCARCALDIFRGGFGANEVAAWPPGRIIQALGPEGPHDERFAVLAHAPSVPGKAVGAWKAFHGCIVDNLGYVSESPMAGLIRQAAMDACVAIGKPVMPVLLERCRQEPWQLMANCIYAASLIDTSDRVFHNLLLRGLQHPDPEIRRHLARAAGRAQKHRWAKDALAVLGRDADSQVREEAHQARYYPHHERRQRPSRAAELPGGYFRCLAETVNRHAGDHGTDPEIVERELRLAFHGGDSVAFQQASYRARIQGLSVEALVAGFCNSPFDGEWFGSLEPTRRTDALFCILRQALHFCLKVDGALAHAMDPAFLGSLDPQTRINLWYYAVGLLLFSGRMEDVSKALDEAVEFIPIGVRGWMALITGDVDAAISHYEADLEGLRRRTREKRPCFHGHEGLFYIMALMKKHASTGDDALLGKALAAVEASLDSGRVMASLHGVYGCLRCILKVMLRDPAWTPDRLPEGPERPGVLDLYFFALASLLATGAMDRGLADELRLAAEKAGQAGMYWFSVEIAALLDRAGADCGEEVGRAAQAGRALGIRAVTPDIKAEDVWRRGLDALMELDEGREEWHERRLIWLLSMDGNGVSIRPKEQRRSRRSGAWTGGRAMSVRDIAHSCDDEGISALDRRVCRAMLAYQESWMPGFPAESSTGEFLIHFVGHPRVFLEESPQTVVEIVRGEPEVFVRREGRFVVVRPSVAQVDGDVVVVRESPVRIRVIELDDTHRRVLRILGRNGLRVPEETAAELMAAVRKLSSKMIVQSSLEDASLGVEQCGADPTPCIHIVPSGQGFRLELFVRPFATAGPYLKPGLGGTVVFADIDGKRLEAVRDLDRERERARTVVELCSTNASAQIGEMRWHLEDPVSCLNVLAGLYPLNSDGQVRVEWPEGAGLRLRGVASCDRLRLRVSWRHDWFDIEGGLDLGDEVIGLRTLMEAIERSPGGFVPLDDGAFLALTEEFRRKLGDLASYATRRKDAAGFHPLALFPLEALRDEARRFEMDPAAQARYEAFRQALSLEPEVPPTFQAELRDYQREGFQWLARLAAMGAGACLADDMGLGKTIQALALLVHRAGSGPALVVAPTSVCMNWANEAARFAPTLNVMLLNRDRSLVKREMKPFDVLVASYGLLLQEQEALSSLRWSTIVLDEAQAIKNVSAKRTGAALSLKGDFRLVTTGTPIENHLGEIHSLFHFLNPGLLGSRKSFMERFAEAFQKRKDPEARRRLKRMVQPFILRRLKSAVLDELPPLTEIVLEVEMGAEEAALYESLRSCALEKISGLDMPAARQRVHILAEIMRLRRACCSPRLVVPDSTIPGAKMEVFGDVVEGLRENRHKALVFSQFVGHLALVREYLDSRGVSYCYLDGSTPAAKRQEQVDAFQAGRAELFLISLKAGGMGLNLTAADYVIHLDPWWNPAVEDQAGSRAHRMGQDRPVTVYRLVARNTIEEKIIALHHQKRDLADSLLEGTDMSARISAEELIALIRDR